MSAPIVLVVDDEDYILRILSFALRAEGWQVLTASNGDETLKQVEREKPDLVVLDLMMPVIDGYQVLKRLRADPVTRDLPIIVLSAKGREFDRDAALELGADDYFTKPFSPQRLVERIQGLLATSGA